MSMASQIDEELLKLKETFHCNLEETRKWARSQKIVYYSDEEFADSLESLSEKELQAAVQILERHIDLEQQCVKCLEAINYSRSGKAVDVAQELVAGQSRLARLRSRLLRCITQQLQQKYRGACCLPVWFSGLPFGNLVDIQVTGGQSNLHPGEEQMEDSVFDEPEETSLNQTQAAAVSCSTGQKLPISIKREELEKGAGPSRKEAKIEVSKEQKAEELPQPSRCTPPKPAPFKESGKGKKGKEARKNDGTKQKVPQKAATSEEILDETDAVVAEQNYVLDWDPTPILRVLFGDVRPCGASTTESRESTIEDTRGNVRMAGYMDKLPVKNKSKKGSVFRSWKKRYFRAVNGELQYYEDHRSSQPLGCVDLDGCKVRLIEEKMLEIVEQKGRTLNLKCASVSEAEDWREAIDTESKISEADVTEDARTVDLIIVIDLGSSSIKAGFAAEEAWPQVMFPCVCAIDKEDSDSCVYGFEALLPENRKKSKLCFPLRRSLKVDKLRYNTDDLVGLMNHCFKQLHVDPTKHKVIMAIPQNTGSQEKEELVEILLDHFQVQAVYLQEQSILAMYSYSAVSGIVVDIGDHIDVVPVVEGYIIEKGATRLPYGGRQVTDTLARMMTEKGYRFFSEVETYISRLIKEKVCYVAEQAVTDDEDPNESTTTLRLDKYNLPDGTKNITIDTARFRCTEGLFSPEKWGKDHPGIHNLTHKAIMACSLDMRKQMCRSIYLSGGSSMFPGFAERLQAEVQSLMPSTSHVSVHAGVDRHHAAFFGASVVARLPLFEQLCVTMEDWNEIGPEALTKWENM